MTRTLEVAMAATYWAGIRIDSQLREWRIPLERRGERLRLLCDAYALQAVERASLLAYRREARRPRGTTPIEIIRANLRWTEEHAAELATFLA